MIDKISKGVRRLQMHLMRKAFADATSQYRFTLLGDSITYGLGRAEHFDNYGVTSETSVGLLNSMHMYLPSIQKTQMTFVMIGTNDIWQHNADGLESRLTHLSQAIPAGKALIWSTIPPLLDSTLPERVNDHIYTLAGSRHNTTVIDMWALFRDQVDACLLDDRVHLSPHGYRCWTSAMKMAMVLQ